jgi:hypothetical protein
MLAARGAYAPGVHTSTGKPNNERNLYACKAHRMIDRRAQCPTDTQAIVRGCVSIVTRKRFRVLVEREYNGNYQGKRTSRTVNHSA